MNTRIVLKGFLKINYLINLDFIVLYKMNGLMKKIVHMLFILAMLK